MGILEAIVLAVSLCADCFAVTLCSSVKLKSIQWKNVAAVAMSFAVIQAGLLLVGWAFGNLFVGLISKISHIIGFLLLLYVGGNMLIEGIRAICGHDDDARDLNGFRNIVLGGIATSIDALAVGVSQSMVQSTQNWAGFSPLFWAVFVVTALSAVSGILGGKFLGHKLGHWAEIIGGCILIGIGASLLFQ